MSKLWKVLIVTADALAPLLPMSQSQAAQRDKEISLSKIRKSVQEGKHAFIVGRSGMGKTYLTKALIKRKLEIQPWLNVYHVDSKKRGDYSSRDGIMYRTEMPPPVFHDGGNKLVWQPIDDNIERYSKFFLSILNAGIPAIVNVDESVNMVFGSTSNIPRGLKILLSQGRLPGIHVYGGTQELANAPRQMISQSTHLFGFNVENDYDERMLMSYLRISKEKGKHLSLKKQDFYYRNRDLGGDPQLYHDANVFVSRFL